ncbi:MAG: hypothetical protein ABIR34_13670 [Marmoricola sp.]
MVSKRALITGSPERVASLAKGLEQAGDEPVSLDDLGPATGAIDRYVQLGTTVPARGDTVVRRVHSFLSDGLLERFALAERILPLLAEDATVLLVGGNLSAETAAPDDQAARLMMLRVLAHAIRADLAPKRVRVRVITGERSDEEIVQFALSGAKDPRAELPILEALDPARSYEDWRTQVLGMAQVEV